MPQYIPTRDADLVTWSNNFSSLITTSPATYGLVSGDATAIAASNATWIAAYAVAVNPSTRTPQTVTAKDNAKVSLLAVVRPYAQRISKNAGISPSVKVAVGVNPGTNGPTPIVAPTTNPIVSVVNALPLQHVIRYRDQLASPSVKAKPAGVVAMQLFGKVSATVITDPEELPFIQIDTKSPLLVEWGSGDTGKAAYYAGRWQTRKGLVGPWSPVVAFTVAG